VAALLGVVACATTRPEPVAKEPSNQAHVAQKPGDLSAGALAPATASAGRTSVPVKVAGNIVVVDANVNETPAALLVDTGASNSVLSPALAQRLGITVPIGAPMRVLHVAGGGTISVPFVRLKSLTVGAATVEDLDVGVYDIVPFSRTLDGVLGTDFLRHFRVAIDHHARRLTLDVRQGPAAASSPAAVEPPGATPSPAKTTSNLPGGTTSPGPEAPLETVSAPVWAVGDQWAFRWESPRGSGTFVWTVTREQAMAGVDCYVIAAGRRHIFYRRTDLAFVEEHVDGVVERRAVPPALHYAWPLALGRSWEERYTNERPVERQTDTRSLRSVVEAEETVVVPAGTFRAFKIVRRHTRGEAIDVETWYAPAARQLVRQRVHFNYGVQERELTSYSIR
jgi:hypothetical protein